MPSFIYLTRFDFDFCKTICKKVRKKNISLKCRKKSRAHNILPHYDVMTSMHCLRFMPLFVFLKWLNKSRNANIWYFLLRRFSLLSTKSTSHFFEHLISLSAWSCHFWFLRNSNVTFFLRFFHFFESYFEYESHAHAQGWNRQNNLANLSHIPVLKILSMWVNEYIGV